ncbi:MAG: B12-binding domain-containing radical SAM protein, partial [Desulfovibrionaceae bacterium]
SSPVRPEITATPAPRWELIDFRDYASMAVQYSRGCPFDCEFCSIVVMNGRVPRVKAPDQMLREIDSLYTAGYRGVIFIVDDNFIGNKGKVKRFLPELARWQAEHKYPFKFMTEASVNLAQDEELMRLMSEANFHKVFLGIETPDVDSLKECGKQQNVAADIPAAIRAINGHGMQVMGGFIVGFDSDTESIFERQIRFIQENGVVTAMVGVLSAIPKTRLWKRLRDENRLLGSASGDNTDGSPNFVPRMDMDTLVGGYRRILDTIYSTKHYYKRIGTFLKNYHPTVRGRTDAADIKAWLKSLWVIGVVSRARFRYWLLMLKTLLTKRKAFPVAVEMAIMGRHFERMARRVIREAVALEGRARRAAGALGERPGHEA